MFVPYKWEIQQHFRFFLAEISLSLQVKIVEYVNFYQLNQR